MAKKATLKRVPRGTLSRESPRWKKRCHHEGELLYKGYVVDPFDGSVTRVIAPDSNIVLCLRELGNADPLSFCARYLEGEYDLSDIWEGIKNFYPTRREKRIIEKYFN